MPAIRNIAVAQGRIGTTGINVVYTVPSGFALILKSALIWNLSGNTANINLRLVTAAQTSFADLQPNPSVAPSASSNWSGWTVLNAGDSVVIQTDQTTVDYWIAGALLPHAP